MVSNSNTLTWQKMRELLLGFRRKGIQDPYNFMAQDNSRIGLTMGPFIQVRTTQAATKDSNKGTAGRNFRANQITDPNTFVRGHHGSVHGGLGQQTHD
jgi:hypothetical protein